MRTRYVVMAGEAVLSLALLGACSEDNTAARITPDAETEDISDSADVAAEVAPSDTDVAPVVLGSCTYVNAFSGSAECREYAGTWTEAAAKLDCEAVFFGTAGTWASEACAVAPVIGSCVIGDVSADGYATYSTGDASGCDAAKLGCESFGGGTFAPTAICASGAACEERLPATASTFVPPYLDCRPPLSGEPAGASEGQVCTTTMISASTEPGRYYPAYADCGVVRRQRPYYGDPPTLGDTTGDPRLEDAAYMGEVEWLKGEVRASACTCCHDSAEAPDGAAVWDVNAGPLWIDSVSDKALAMLVGLTDSRYFGFYPAEQNNGFDRSQTGLPTTDVARLKAFGRLELARRGLTEAQAAELPPFAPFFRELVEYEPEACPEGVGVGANGELRWDGVSARYISVLRAGSASPGVQPNYDLPDGTLWALAADPTEPSIACGLTYGSVPDGSYQRFPADGAAPEALVSGQSYYLHVQRDLAFPVTRCVFVAP